MKKVLKKTPYIVALNFKNYMILRLVLRIGENRTEYYGEVQKEGFSFKFKTKEWIVRKPNKKCEFDIISSENIDEIRRIVNLTN